MCVDNTQSFQHEKRLLKNWKWDSASSEHTPADQISKHEWFLVWKIKSFSELNYVDYQKKCHGTWQLFSIIYWVFFWQVSNWINFLKPTFLIYSVETDWIFKTGKDGGRGKIPPRISDSSRVWSGRQGFFLLSLKTLGALLAGSPLMGGGAYGSYKEWVMLCSLAGQESISCWCY